MLTYGGAGTWLLQLILSSVGGEVTRLRYVWLQTFSYLTLSVEVYPWALYATGDLVVLLIGTDWEQRELWLIVHSTELQHSTRGQ